MDDNNFLKTDIKLESASPIKINNDSIKLKDFFSSKIMKPIINNDNTLEQNIKNNNYSNTEKILAKYSLKLNNDNKFDDQLNKSFSLKKDVISENKMTSNSNDSFCLGPTSGINKIHYNSKEAKTENNGKINSNKMNLQNNPSQSTTPIFEYSLNKLRHSSSTFLRNNSSDNFSDFNSESLLENKKSNSFSNDSSPSCEKNKELKSLDKRRSLSSLNLSHFSLNSKRNNEIDKKIEEIRERFRLNEKQQDNNNEKILSNDSSIFHFEAKPINDLSNEKFSTKFHLASDDQKKLNSNNIDDNYDEAVKLIFILINLLFINIKINI